MTAATIEVSDFHKTFRLGLRRRPFVAARGISFSVGRGEVFGFLGPNGAGKTTTIKALLGLIRPDKGSLRLLGLPPDSLEWRRRVGYLPEHPNFYEFLTGLELVTWFGQLSGLARHESEGVAKQLLGRVGLSHAAHRRLRSYSKGMLQRAGLAQAMVSSPEVLILDEPMTGLDPIGRRDIRELILQLRHEGKTIFYSTHILPDVEVTCDRVAIVHEGVVREVGQLDALLRDSTQNFTIRIKELEDAKWAPFRSECVSTRGGPGWIELVIQEEGRARGVLAGLQGMGAEVISFHAHREDLEEIFIRTLGAKAPDVVENRP